MSPVLERRDSKGRFAKTPSSRSVRKGGSERTVSESATTRASNGSIGGDRMKHANHETLSERAEAVL